MNITLKNTTTRCTLLCWKSQIVIIHFLTNLGYIKLMSSIIKAIDFLDCRTLLSLKMQRNRMCLNCLIEGTLSS